MAILTEHSFRRRTPVRRLVLGMLVASVLSASGPLAAQGMIVSNRADQWIGRDAGELLLRFRVDGNQAQIVEDDDTGETHYTWHSATRAWTETVQTQGQVIGMHGRTPVFGQGASYTVDHPSLLKCRVTFTADSEGIIRRWTMDGNRCGELVVKPD